MFGQAGHRRPAHQKCGSLKQAAPNGFGVRSHASSKAGIRAVGRVLLSAKIICGRDCTGIDTWTGRCRHGWRACHFQAKDGCHGRPRDLNTGRSPGLFIPGRWGRKIRPDGVNAYRLPNLRIARQHDTAGRAQESGCAASLAALPRCVYGTWPRLMPRVSPESGYA